MTRQIGNARYPPGEAIRGPARPSIAFDPSERLKPTLSGPANFIRFSHRQDEGSQLALIQSALGPDT
jgi:hypothetical protein